MIVYEAFFVDHIINSKLSRDIEFKHITTEYKPAKTHEHLYGQKAVFIATGYGNDGVNEGLSVKLVSCDSDELRELYEAIPVPHITLSVSEEGKPVNTKDLEFDTAPEFKISTTFGGYNGREPYFGEGEQ